MKHVFVYGSLKSGFHNHGRIFSGRGNVKVKDYTTPAIFLMWDLGFFPGVELGGDTPIKGEIWRVTDATLMDIRRLEMSYKEITVDADGIECLMYVRSSEPSWHYGLVPSGEWTLQLQDDNSKKRQK